MMKKSIIAKVFTSLLLILLFILNSHAQKPKRLNLSKSPSSVMEEKVAAGGTKKFVFYLKKGKKIKISFIEDTRKGTLDFEKYSAEEGTENGITYAVTVSKDYTLILTNPNKKATSFRVFFSVE